MKFRKMNKFHIIAMFIFLIFKKILKVGMISFAATCQIISANLNTRAFITSSIDGLFCQ